jgi:NitT/TauT family transport system substrate-binding protein
MPLMQTRRSLLTSLALGAAAGILPPRTAEAAEPPLETTSVRLLKDPTLCYAPAYLSNELLRAEGFTDIRYVEVDFDDTCSVLGRGLCDFGICLTMNFIVGIDRGDPVTILSGAHAGCFELFANASVRGITDLKGKSVGTSGGPELAQAIASYVGLEPKKDITLVVSDNSVNALEMFAQGKIDAYLALPPEPQDLHARRIGHVILRTAVDEPWSQYFCCMIAANRDYVQKHPVATKRVIRALLKNNDLCIDEPERTARRLVEGGFADNYDYALQTLNENPYRQWRDYDTEDSVRFYALRLRDIGMIKNNPRQIIAEGTNSRFFNELKRELKA